MDFKKTVFAGVLAVSSLLTACAGRGYYAYNVPPPPAARYGAVGYAPGPGYVWADGYWDLRGSRWAWVNGRWDRPPRGHHEWVRARWEPSGRSYRFHRGYWR